MPLITIMEEAEPKHGFGATEPIANEVDIEATGARHNNIDEKSEEGKGVLRAGGSPRYRSSATGNNEGIDTPQTKTLPPALPKVTREDCLKEHQPLHYACEKGASLDVIKYLVEGAYDGDKGKELLAEKDACGRYPIHFAGLGGATLEVVKYLVEEAYDVDKGKELLAEKDNFGQYPIHHACLGGVSLDVVKYLMEEAYDGNKGKELFAEKDAYGRYPIHFAGLGGASLDVIKYLVEEAYDGDKGKELLAEKDGYSRYPIHCACYGGDLDVIKYLVEEAQDADKGKELLAEKDYFGQYPIHHACYGASLEVVKYLVEEAYDGNKGKELLSEKDDDGWYPIHLACKGGATLEVVQYIIRKNPLLLETKDTGGMMPLDYVDNDTLRTLFPSHQIGNVADKSSNVDRLNYILFAQALACAARKAERPETSLCVGLYGRCGDGKSTLWKQIRKILYSEFLQEDVQLLYNAWQCLGANMNEGGNVYAAAKKSAEKPFQIAVGRLYLHPYVLQKTKEMWKTLSTEKKSEPLQTLIERLVCFFLRITYWCKLGHDDGGHEHQTSSYPHIQRIQDTSRDARSRSNERTAITFVLFMLLFPISFPIWILVWLIHSAPKRIVEAWSRFLCHFTDDDAYLEAYYKAHHRASTLLPFFCPIVVRGMREQARQIANIISGNERLGDGDSTQWGVTPVGTFLVIISLQLVQAIAHLFVLVQKTLKNVLYFSWCCNKSDYTPSGAVEYKIVEFNAWTYQASELLWASLMKELWGAVEAQYGKKAVKYHRVGIALAGENKFDEAYRALSTKQKALNRKRALLMFQLRSYLSLFLFLIAVMVTLVKYVEEDNGAGVITALIFSVAAFCPLLAQIITFSTKVLPYIRKTRGEYIFGKAAAASKRKDFSEELGFMGEVKTEIEYLFDLLSTETYLDKDVGCHRSLRLCVFIDDLDRCPSKTVVSVLEAVILLLVDGPISVWMAIDSRIVVQCIEKEKEGVFDKANINGHEFLDKIIQMPFALPSLPHHTKQGYLNTIIGEKELDPHRVLARFDREGIREKLSIASTDTSLSGEKDHYSQLADIASAMEGKGNLEVGPEQEVSVSELIGIFKNNPQHASAEHKENLCSIVTKSTSHLLDLETGIRRKNGTFLLEDPTMQSSRKNHTFDHSDDPATSDINVSPPPPGVYIPMLNENERECLVSFVPYINGNPRRMKRIINVFNVSRHIAERRCGKSSATLLDLGPKILKLTILLEQWPYRMAWLLQIIEDVEQMCTHHVRDSSLVQFLQERFKESYSKAHDKSLYWDILCNIDIHHLYQNGIHHLMNNEDLSNMQSIDSDPQLFEGLLLNNGSHTRSAESDGPYAITVKDLRSIGQEVGSQEHGECLRGYMFNMPLSIVDTVAKMTRKSLDKKECKISPTHQISETFDDALEPSVDDFCRKKKPLLYKRKITECIDILFLEREKCAKAGLPTDNVDAEIYQLQQERNAILLKQN